MDAGDSNPSKTDAASVVPLEVNLSGDSVDILKKLVITSLLFLWCPLVALAHPMGNFSINHYSKLVLEGQEIRIDYILDFAEIPTFQMFPGARAGDLGPETGVLAAQWTNQLRLTAGANALPLTLLDSKFEIRPGAGTPSTLARLFV